MGALRSRVRMNAAAIRPTNEASSLPAPRLVESSNNGRSEAQNKPTVIAHANGEERLQHILELIESGQPCTIQALAQELNLSHSRLQHLFKQKTGLSLGHLLTRQRLDRAAHLLTHSNKRIKEIAHAVGYEHASSFIRAFERHFAQPPRLFRQTQQEKAN